MSSSYASVAIIISLLLAVIATILAFIFIVPEKREKGMNKFGRFLHKTVNFKYLIIEKILQAFYILTTVLCIVFGFFMLFSFQEVHNYSYSYYTGVHTTTTTTRWVGWVGLLIMIFGPLFIRLMYEGFFMMILLVKNVMSINNKLKNQNDTTQTPGLFSSGTPDMLGDSRNTAPYAPNPDAAAWNTRFCQECGSPLDRYGRCPHCND